MPLIRKFRLYAVTIHDKTSRDAIVPEHEIPVIRAGWRGTEITTQVTNDVRELNCDGPTAFRSLLNRYAEKAVVAVFSGPERLEKDMEIAADKTEQWLAAKAAAEEAEDRKAKAFRRAEVAREEAEAKAKADAEAKAAAEAEKKKLQTAGR